MKTGKEWMKTILESMKRALEHECQSDGLCRALTELDKHQQYEPVTVFLDKQVIVTDKTIEFYT